MRCWKVAAFGAAAVSLPSEAISVCVPVGVQVAPNEGKIECRLDRDPNILSVYPLM